MAYMSQERKTRLAALAKTALAKWPRVKWTLSVRHHSTIVLTIREGDIDFLGAARAPDARRPSTTDELYLDVNHHLLDREWVGEARAFLRAAFDALNDGNFDRSDLQSDVFNVGWYVDVTIGRFDRPYRFTGEPVASAPESGDPANDTAAAPEPEPEPADDVIDAPEYIERLIARGLEVAEEMFPRACRGGLADAACHGTAWLPCTPRL